MSSLFSSPDTPQQPKFVPVDIAGTTALATKADQDAYGRNDADFAQRFPQLVKARQTSLDDSINQLGGGIGKQSTGALVAAGLAPEAASMSTGNEFQTSKNEGRGVLDKESRDRNYFESELGQEGQQRVFGPSGGNILQEALANTGNLNAANNSAYLTGVNAYNSSVQQGAQNTAGYASLLASAIKSYYSTPSATSSFYTDPTNNPYAPTPDYGRTG